MSRLSKILGASLSLLVFGGLIFFLIQTLDSLQDGKPQQTTFQSPLLASTAMPTLTPIPVVNKPISPISTPYTPPLCQFDAKSDVDLTETASLLDKYVFSKPEVIFSQEGNIEIIEWLPDNQHLLIHIQGDEKQSIEVLDVKTGKTQVYADDLQNANRVHWVVDENGVVYSEHKTTQFSGIDQNGIWLSKGEKQQAELLLEGADLFKTEKIVGNLPANIARIFNVYDFPFNPDQWLPEEYVAERRFAWSVSPDGTKALFFGVPWLYLVDLKTGQSCQVDWGMDGYRAYTLQWDVGGRYAAMPVANNALGEPMFFNRLVILDTFTGQVYKPEVAGWSHIWDFQWFPDSRHLIVMGFLSDIEQPQLNEPIGIVDSVTEKFYLIMPDQAFAQGSQTGFQLALSPDGKFFAVNCPIISEQYSLGLLGQVCLSEVN